MSQTNKTVVTWDPHPAQWVQLAVPCAESLQLYPVLCDPIDHSPPVFSVHGISLGKNIGVGCRFLLQEIFPTRDQNHEHHQLVTPKTCSLAFKTHSLHSIPKTIKTIVENRASTLPSGVIKSMTPKQLCAHRKQSLMGRRLCKMKDIHWTETWEFPELLWQSWPDHLGRDR